MQLTLPLTFLALYVRSTIGRDLHQPPATGVTYCDGKKLTGLCKYLPIDNTGTCYPVKPKTAGSMNLYLGAAVMLFDQPGCKGASGGLSLIDGDPNYGKRDVSDLVGDDGKNHTWVSFYLLYGGLVPKS